MCDRGCGCRGEIERLRGELDNERCDAEFEREQAEKVRRERDDARLERDTARDEVALLRGHGKAMFVAGYEAGRASVTAAKEEE